MKKIIIALLCLPFLMFAQNESKIKQENLKQLN